MKISSSGLPKFLVLVAGIIITPMVALGEEIQMSREQYDFILNCQGCHRSDGSETPGSVPPIKHHVARFLGVPGGREFIIRVPGVASAPLSDEAIANLMNWLLVTFDPEHVPPMFQAYTSAEVRELRSRPLTGRVLETRTALIAAMRSAKAGEQTGH